MSTLGLRCATARQMVIKAAQRLDLLTGFPAAYMVAVTLGILVEALTDTPREEARFTCHLFAGIAVIGLLIMAPEAVSFDFATLCAFVILLRAFYDVSATFANSGGAGMRVGYRGRNRLRPDN